jgi:hypothetical protein
MKEKMRGEISLDGTPNNFANAFVHQLSGGMKHSGYCQGFGSKPKGFTKG